MRMLAATCSLVFLTSVAPAQEDSGPVCRVTVLKNTVDVPEDRRDGLVLMRVFVSTSSNCLNGQVRIAAFPAAV